MDIWRPQGCCCSTIQTWTCSVTKTRLRFIWLRKEGFSRWLDCCLFAWMQCGFVYPELLPMPITFASGIEILLQTAQLVIERGSRADINVKNDMSATLLHTKSLEGHLDVAKWLLDSGAGMNSKVILGYNTPAGCIMQTPRPLNSALGRGDLKKTRLLL
jgi:hypothetical protein